MSPRTRPVLFDALNGCEPLMSHDELVEVTLAVAEGEVEAEALAPPVNGLV